MSDTHERQIASKKPGNASPLRSLTPVPVPVPGDEGYRRQPFLPQQTSWWQSCVQWFRYYSIQIRWDVERALARLFHRHWP
jgi:hypothetical protein